MSIRVVPAREGSTVPTEQDRAHVRAVVRAQPSGFGRYRMGVAEDMEGRAIDEMIAPLGGWNQVSPDQIREMASAREARLGELEATTPRVRWPGWTVEEVPPLYINEAVAFDTEWGPIVLGRSLARIYDMDGWPDAVTMREMAVQQAARMAVPA